MQLRNLTRVFCFNRALEAFNQDTGYNLKQMEVNVLLVIYFLQGTRGVGVGSMLVYLSRFKRSMRQQQLTDIIAKFKALGFVCCLKTGVQLTITGRNVLLSLEKTCRLTRYDK